MVWKCFHCYDRLYCNKSYSDGSQDSEKSPCPFCLPDEYAMWQRKRAKEFLATCCLILLLIVVTVLIANSDPTGRNSVSNRCPKTPWPSPS